MRALRILLLLSCATLLAVAQPADQILVNGKVLTVDEDFSIAEAIAIRHDRIIAVGSNQEIRQRAAESTKVRDLGGKTVLPGLIDNHFHFIRAVQR